MSSRGGVGGSPSGGLRRNRGGQTIKRSKTRRPSGERKDLLPIERESTVCGDLRPEASPESEQRVAETVRRLAAIQELSDDFVAIVDSRGRLSYLNPAGRRLVGLRPEEDLGDRPLRMFYAFESQPLVDEGISSAVRTGGACCELTLVDAKGNELPVLQTVLVHRRQDGSIDFLSAIARDARALKELEQKLFKKQNLEAVGRLACSLTHDFNNLLTVITGMSELILSQSPAASPICDDLRMILDLTAQGASLVKRLSLYSRQAMMTPGPVSVNAIVRTSERILRRAMGEDVILNVDLKAEEGDIRAIAGELEQVLLNLILNARDAMPMGGCLSIRTRNVELADEEQARLKNLSPGRYVVLSVEDSGVGMSADVRARIFEPFFTTKKPGTGTGLGLVSVLEIVMKCGGTIQVQSSPGHGTTFDLFLPCQPSSAQSVAEVSLGSRPASPSLPNQTVLVLDDDENVRVFCSRVLEAKGYRVLEASAIEEAFSLVHRQQGAIDLLISDSVAGKQQEAALVDSLQQKWPDAKVLSISASCERDPSFKDSPTHLPKPFTPDALTQRVKDLLALRPVASRSDRKLHPKNE